MFSGCFATLNQLRKSFWKGFARGRQSHQMSFASPVRLMFQRNQNEESRNRRGQACLTTRMTCNTKSWRCAMAGVSFDSNDPAHEQVVVRLSVLVQICV